MKITALIMAGGRGERFWPQSRSAMPKQFINLLNPEKSMIQLTVERILPLVSVDDIYIATNQAYKEIVRRQLPDLPENNILCEPMGRNTAPCIGLGAVHIAKRCGEDAIMIVLPSDHMIEDPDALLKCLEAACQSADASNDIITIGIRPSSPNTGYGYIKYRSDGETSMSWRVDSFKEKPDLCTAQKYLESGMYLWNSGMFIWKVSTILSQIREYLPKLYSGLNHIGNAIDTVEEETVTEREFREFESISIDYGVLEKSDHVRVLSGNFQWDDVGTWNSVGRLEQTDEYGNSMHGNVVSVATRNTIVRGDKRLIAVVGLDDVVVVDTEDILLVCDKQHTGQIKDVIETLKKENRIEYL